MGAKADHGPYERRDCVTAGVMQKGLFAHSTVNRPKMSEWQFTRPAVALRGVLICVALIPVMAIFSRRRTFGLEHLKDLEGPVIFAANHLSVADNPAVLLALPWRWRLRVATAASREVMRDRGRIQSFFAALISNGFHFSQTGAVRSSLAFCSKLTAAGWSLLYFPEGERSDDGTVGSFRPGIGLLAAGTGVPVVPVYIKGTDSVVSKGGSRPHRSDIEVRFGEPMLFSRDSDHVEATQQIRSAVASLSQKRVP